MTKRQNPKINITKVIVAVITATAVILGAYWQYVWNPSHQSPTPTSQQVEYIGRVIDSETESPVRGAKVTLDFQDVPPIVYTDSEGIYKFSITFENDRLAGRVRVEAADYKNYDRNIILLASTQKIEDIRLNPILSSEVIVAADTPTNAPSPTPEPPTDTPIPSDTPTPKPTNTPEPPADTPVLTPTDTQTPESTGQLEPSIPTNYIVFDNFDDIGTLDTSQWVIGGKLEDCNGIQDSGILKIQCKTESGDVNLGYWPKDESKRNVHGIAIASEVFTDDYLGSMDVNITFDGADGSEQRVYFLQLRYSEFKVAEIYPQDDWRGIDLAKVAVVPSQVHVIQAEYQSGVFNIWLDGVQIEFQPNLPSNPMWRDWKLEPFVAGPQGREAGLLEANVLWVAILP